MNLVKNIKRLVRRYFLNPLIRLFTGRERTWKELQAMAEAVRQKECITVAFMALELAYWRCDSVYQAMSKHPRFRPIIWIIRNPLAKDELENYRKLEAMRSYFAERHYTVVEFYSLQQMREEYNPDVVFIAKIGIDEAHWNARLMNKELLCYVPYCFFNSKMKDFVHEYGSFFWRNYYTTDSIKQLAAAVMTNRGRNILPVGSPIVDCYISQTTPPCGTVWKDCGKEKKRIIWAPHWSIEDVTWYSVSTFLEMAEGMLILAEKYEDRLQWAFKPHPLLKIVLYQHSDWGTERTDAYYARWASMPNSQLETDAYVDLFKLSDAMVHDSGGFIIEYLAVNKPCMYLQRKAGFQDFNDDTIKALECYYKGYSVSDVEQFILDILNGKTDSKKAIRTRYREEYLIPPGGSSAELIIEDILHGKLKA